MKPLRRASFVRYVVGLFVVLCMPFTYASPIISIGEGGDMTWQQALDNGGNLTLNRIEAANDLTSAAQAFYATQVPPGQAVPVQPDLFANNSVQDQNGEAHDSLVMQWDQNQDPNILSVASWDFHYGVDPDLRNAKIHFSVLAPPGIWDISLELIDINGNSIGWFLPGNGTGIWTEFWIKAYNWVDQDGFLFFHGGGNFELDKVVTIRLNESGMFQDFPVFDPAAPLGVGGSQQSIFWNAWNHLRVDIPEPGTLMLGILGLVLLFVRRATIR